MQIFIKCVQQTWFKIHLEAPFPPTQFEEPEVLIPLCILSQATHLCWFWHLLGAYGLFALASV